MVHPQDFAQKGEIFLTNRVLRPDEAINTRSKLEGYMIELYSDYTLRFQYDNLVFGWDVMSSEDYGYACTNLPRGQAHGVAIYGKKKVP